MPVTCIRVEANGDIRVPHEFHVFESDPADATVGTPDVLDEETGAVITPGTKGGPGWLHEGKGRWARFVDEPPAFDPAIQTRARTVPANVPSGPVTVEYAVSLIPLTDLKAARLAALAEYRWQRELAGVSWNGITLDTTDRGKGLLHGAMTRLQRRPEGTTTRWKAAPGVEFPIDLATAEAAFDALADHVDALFAKELDHAAAIVAVEAGGEVTEIEAAEAVATYDFTTGWPS